MPVDAAYLRLMLVGYALTVAVETAVLAVGLSRRHGRLVTPFAGLWLTACTYPVVWLVLPPLFDERWAYLLVAEVFAPLAEAVLFWLAFVRGRPPDPGATRRDVLAVVGANVCSFLVGEVVPWADIGW